MLVHIGVQAADALVTDRPGLLLAIVTADCAPVLLADRDARVIGAAHAGWRGALSGVLGNTVSAMVALGARPERISAVIGPYADTLLALARCCDVQVIRHSGPADELVASQRLAVHEHLRQQPGADLMLLVADLPLLAADDIRPLLRAWAQRPAHTQAQVPVVGGVRGHPVLLSWQAVQAVAEQPWPHAVRTWMLANTGTTQWLQADRDAYVTDLDTPDDLQALRSRLAGASIAWPKQP